MEGSRMQCGAHGEGPTEYRDEQDIWAAIGRLFLSNALQFMWITTGKRTERLPIYPEWFGRKA